MIMHLLTAPLIFDYELISYNSKYYTLRFINRVVG